MLYRGRYYKTIKCENFVALQIALQDGHWFRTNTDLDFYYKMLPASAAPGYEMPEDIVKLRSVCVTSFSTKFTYFYKIEQSTGGHIYFGNELKDLICKELKEWTREMNPSTLRAFGGKSFVSYLKAIPDEIYFSFKFLQRMQKALASGFARRGCDELSKRSQELLLQTYEEKNRSQAKLEHSALTAFEKVARERDEDRTR